jgi:tetratricopeptide (TPR) repeat protein
MSATESVKRHSRPRSPGVDIRDGSVREARQNAGLSLAKLAGQELSRGAIYLIESGRSRPSIATLKLIAARTRKPISFFLPSETTFEPQLFGAPGLEVIEAERLCLAGRFDQAVTSCEALLTDVIDPHTEARLRLCLGRATLGLGRAEEARPHLEQARDQLAGLEDPWLQAECQTALAAAACSAHESDSLALAQEAIEACQAVDPVPRLTLARAHTTAGDYHAAERRWPEAAQHYELAMEQVAGQRTLAVLSDFYEALGRAHVLRRNALQAAEWRLRAAALLAAREDLSLQATLHLKLSEAQLGSGQSSEARLHLREALTESDRLDLESVKARVLLAQAQLALAEDQIEEAERLARASTELAEQVGERRCLALGHCTLGRLAAAQGDLPGRDREFLTAFTLLSEAEDRKQLIDAHVAYAELLEVSRQIEQALKEWKQAVKLSRPHLEHLTPTLSGAV